MLQVDERDRERRKREEEEREDDDDDDDERRKRSRKLRACSQRKHRSRKGSFPFLSSSHTPHLQFLRFIIPFVPPISFCSIVVIIIITAIIAIDITVVILFLPLSPAPLSLHPIPSSSSHLASWWSRFQLVSSSMGLTRGGISLFDYGNTIHRYFTLLCLFLVLLNHPLKFSHSR